MDPEIELNGQPTDDEILASQNQEGTPPVAAAPVEPSFDASGLGFKFRNETVTPKDRNDAIELLQLGYSYRTNKPKWDADRQTAAQFEARKADYQRYDQLSQALQANPEFRTELEQLANKFNGQKPQAQQNQPPASSVPPELLEKVNKLAEWQEQQKIEREDNDLKRELDELERNNPSYDWKSDSGEGDLRKQLLAFMSKRGVYDPEVALAGMMHKSEIQRAKFEAEKKAADDAAKARKAGVVTPGTQPAPQAPAGGLNHRAMSYDDLENAALAGLGR